MERLIIEFVLFLEALGLLLLVATRLTNEITAFVEALKRLFRGPGSGPEGQA
ncbi:hypothetical protein [Streptomyces kebangsaanensis]|uniref:hypothetical protein n=1 Tax=Streptomyces kebangsaanensis TaxID=864058 RepID=UPI000A8065D7|nr:hypothetical protein [Streptomyces kebangsaanensis]